MTRKAKAVTVTVTAPVTTTAPVEAIVDPTLNPELVTYEMLCREMIDGVNASEVGGSWLKDAAQYVKAFYKTREAATAVKAQLVADAIIPGFSTAEQAVFKTKPAKNPTAEAKAERKAAQDKLRGYWTRMLDYAFGKVVKAEPEGGAGGEADEKGEADTSVKTNEQKLLEHLTAALRLARDIESDAVDAVEVVKGIRAAIAATGATVDGDEDTDAE